MIEINPAAGSINGRRSYTGKIEIIRQTGDVSGKFWIVKAGTREITVFSDSGFKPGEIIRGRIFFSRNILHLEILKKQEAHAAAPVFFSDTIITLEQLAGRFFSETGKKPDNMLTAILKSLIVKKEITKEHQGSLVFEAWNKGFRNQSSILSLLNAISGNAGEGDRGSSGGKGGGKGKNRDKSGGSSSDDAAADIVKAAADVEIRNDSLFLFNHISPADRHWIIIPYQTGNGNNMVKGTIRLKAVKTVLQDLVVHAEKNDSIWFFSLSDISGKGRKMKIYANKKGLSEVKDKKFVIFVKKLQNLGLKIDDNVYELKAFTGFSGVAESTGVDVEV
ncbi:MAG: hypothetical protein RBT69_07935 [Spirochaetia bacterium]|jgi:hypothetical protein|nr:hypothetical protein [Spirochaetia bacterium]